MEILNKIVFVLFNHIILQYISEKSIIITSRTSSLTLNTQIVHKTCRFFSCVRFSLLLRFLCIQNDQWSDINDFRIKQNRSICTLIYNKLGVSTFRIFQNIKVYFMAFLWGHPVCCAVWYKITWLQYLAVFLGYT